jgi:hypothetical protein
MPGASQGWAVDTSCVRQENKNLTLNMYFDTDSKLGGILLLYLVRSGDSYTVKPDDSGQNHAVAALGRRRRGGQHRKGTDPRR